MEEALGGTGVIHDSSKEAFFTIGDKLGYNPFPKDAADKEGDGVTQEVTNLDVQYARPEAEEESHEWVKRGSRERGDDNGRGFKKYEKKRSPDPSLLYPSAHFSHVYEEY